MAVLKSLREISKMEFYRNGLALRNAITNWLLTDFAMKPRKRDIRIVEKELSDTDKETVKKILDNNNINHDKSFQKIAPEWFGDDEKKYLLDLSRDMMRYIVSANSIYVGNNCKQADYDLRRRYQTKAIACVQSIVEEIYEIQMIFPSDMNKTVNILECAEREFDLLKGWRKSENKNDPSLGKN